MPDSVVLEVFVRAAWREGPMPDRLLKVAERAVWRATTSGWDWVDPRVEARVARYALKLRAAALRQEANDA